MKNLWALRYVIAMLAAFGLAVASLLWAARRFPTYLAVVIALLVVAFLVQGWRVKRRNDARGWRLRCVSPEGWVYEEKKAGVWVGITMAELMDYREPPHILRVMSVARWSEYPDWTHGRREEILGRIKAELKEPNYVLEEA